MSYNFGICAVCAILDALAAIINAYAKLDGKYNKHAMWLVAACSRQ
jgi:hypothetical protein